MTNLDEIHGGTITKNPGHKKVGHCPRGLLAKVTTSRSHLDFPLNYNYSCHPAGGSSPGITTDVKLAEISSPQRNGRSGEWSLWYHIPLEIPLLLPKFCPFQAVIPNLTNFPKLELATNYDSSPDSMALYPPEFPLLPKPHPLQAPHTNFQGFPY